MRMRIHWLAAVLLTSALLAGCAPTTTAMTATPAPSATETLAHAATATQGVRQGSFTCPTTVNGAQKTFSDSATGLQFSYPADWTENDCQRYIAETISPSGSAPAQQSILVGNLFIVTVWPRNGQTIQQWVNGQTTSDETVTLTPLTVPHAGAAVTVAVTVSPQASTPPPLSQTMAIVAGSQNFYEVNTIVAQMSATDTIPSLSHTQLVQQVVTTFDVP